MLNDFKIWLQVLWSDTVFFFKKEKSDVYVEIQKKESAMGWVTILANIFKLVPYVVAGVQALHPTADGTTKKDIATNLLNIATAGATQVLSPENAGIAQVVGGSVSQIIDATVQANKAASVPGFTPSTTPASTSGLAGQAAVVQQIPGSMPR